MKTVNVLLNYSGLTEEKIRSVKTNYINKYDTVVSKLLSISNENLSWDNLVQPFINLDNSYVESAIFDMKDFYTNEEIRNVCTEVSTEFSTWGIDESMRKDIYSKFKYYSDNIWSREKENMSEEQQSYFKDKMLAYKIKGMDLPDCKFERVKVIKKELSNLVSEFGKNMGEESYSEQIKVEFLEGLPEKYISERLQSDGTVKVTLKYPDYVPIMEYAKNREVRKHFNTLFKQRCMKENTPLIEKVFSLRSELADNFGFVNYSDYELQESMAGSTDVVLKFLHELLNKIKPLLKNDLDSLGKLAKRDNINKIEMYDIAYYTRIYIETTCNFDKEELKKYFPLETVLSGAFSIYQKLLGYKFTRVNNLNDTFWHPDVELYEVTDSNTGIVIGYFYLDLYPREGKYSHAACFPFISKSNITYPVATMGCNFNKGNLTFDEVETFFHEFGHVMHHLSSESTINSTASFACEQDFVETPSQMFEEWCYEKETLQMMSANLPDELVIKLNQSRKLLQGWHYARQLLFGIFDMTIHSSAYKTMGMKPVDIFNMLQKSILEMDHIEGTSEPASFGHIIQGYQAGYYGYAWSLVYAKDLFSKFKKEGLLNSKVGIMLRDEILSKGSIRPSMESIKIFLGREPTNDEFIKSIV